MPTTVDRTILQGERRASWGRLNHQRLLAALQVNGPMILDLGCAGGAYTGALQQQNHKVFGLDVLRYPEWQTAPRKLFVQGCLPELPFPDQVFNSVLAFELLEHVPEPAQALQEIRRICKDTLLLSVPDCAPVQELAQAGLAYSHYLDRSHCNFFDAPGLRNLLEECGFQVAQIRSINPILSDYPALRSLHLPQRLAYPLARLLAHLPLRKRYHMTLLATARRLA
jgi:SAM-dependent methyltransferase